MQLIMGIGTAEEIALAEVKATEQMKATKVQGHDADPEPAVAEVETKCPLPAPSRSGPASPPTRLCGRKKAGSGSSWCL